MTLHAALTHRTSYRYDRAVTLGPQTIRLRPAPHARTPIVSYALHVEPAGHFINWQQDPQGNFLARVVFPEPVTRFEVTVDLVADMTTINPFDFFLEPDAETWPFAYDPVLESELAPFRKLVEPGPLLAALIATVDREEPRRTVDMLVALNQLVQGRVAYVVRLEPGVWTPEQTLGRAEGSCRDSAWLLAQLLRHLGFAARFVSGYLIQLKPDMAPLEGAAGPTADFTDLHAWAEVYLPGAGWIGLDATSGLLTGEGHIPLAASPEPASAAAISGAVSPSEATFDVVMNVTRLRETARVTKPYDEPTWQRILAAGERVDAALLAGDVRLTMGGEPTFVAAGDTEGAEWNADALGPTKRVLSGRLIRRLAALWSPGAAIQYAAGKHYPGEQLPRWALHAHWRLDGEPVWRDPALLASDEDSEAPDAADADHFARALARRLGLDPDRVLPAHEDAHYYLWREHRLPGNVVVEDAPLRDPLARARLARVYGRGLVAPVGAVLPLRRVVAAGAPAWETGRWLLRSDLLFLVPGDSSIGFRLPLESLPWAADDTIETPHEPDPFAPGAVVAPRVALGRGNPVAGLAAHDPVADDAAHDRVASLAAHDPVADDAAHDRVAGLAAHDPVADDAAHDPAATVVAHDPVAAVVAHDRAAHDVAHNSVGGLAERAATPFGRAQPALRGGPLAHHHGEPGPGLDAFRPHDQRGPDSLALGRGEPDLVRTALTVEVRDGKLHVFLPPLTAAQDWLDLVAAIEDTASSLGRKVILEGYLPPHDPLLGVFSVTPDPGVIEVNVHPARTWREHVERTEQLYREARAVGLAAEKFMIDGRHVGTGGGNHVVMGGATAADSPFLRRPDLLKSLLGFWHNHPSLSYLFSGLFIGPTSQHPRVDEARQDSIAELEIALSRINPGEEAAPWLIDRLLRNLLVDATGNTHRTEFCIDKLYAPEGGGSRLGLVELRSFEMPPHARMSAAQSLLMRTAIAAFWAHPYERRLVRWGTRLHDDFLLPHYVRQDFSDTLAELASLGFPLEESWFEPHLEFRFPRIGGVTLRGIDLELRHALEPWHVLGEVPGIGGTVRYVDSAVERLEARVAAWVPERYILACNGRAVPLTATERQGEFVGGIRFKAWSPAASLHPTIRAQTPLVIEIHDSWSGRALGGITHHVAHPGGRNYETFPVNANEAEARRRARFLPFGHSAGPRAAPRGGRSLEHPRTLDLREG